ncbi:hypothetical protein [Methanobrevibacter sp.]
MMMPANGHRARGFSSDFFLDSNEIIDELKLNKDNINTLKFIFNELIANIYDHSEFENAYVMGKINEDFYEFSFLDDGITIPTSLKKLNYPIKNDCDAIIQAVNGLSSKNELGYIERGTGLNNTTNIVTSSSDGEVLIVSGCGLIHITKDKITARKIPNDCIDGTLVSITMKLDHKIDIYKYLKQVKYDLII